MTKESTRLGNSLTTSMMMTGETSLNTYECYEDWLKKRMTDETELLNALRDLEQIDPREVDKVLRLCRQLKQTERLRYHPRLIALYGTLAAGLMFPLLLLLDCHHK